MWIPILDADEGSEVPSAATNIAVTPQYFDGQKRVGDQLAKVFGVSEPVWDAFFFYPPGAKWTDGGLPLPELAIAQQGGVVARLVPALRGKAVVIGEQENFETILQQVASAFVERHRKR